MSSSDTSTFELSQACLRLKGGLHFSVQRGRYRSWYLVEDDARSTFFRIGAAEYTFLSLLDGRTTLSSAVATTCTTLGANALSERDAINLCKWLIDSNLAHTSASTTAERMREQTDRQARLAKISKLNPIAIQFPLIELDRFAAYLNRSFSWLVSVPALLVWVLICGYALTCLAINSERVGQVSVFGRDNLAWMAITWLVLKGFHEMAHLLVCKKFGGKVGKGGILLLLMIPMPYVDVTSSWRFASKYHRILTSAAGMLAEIFLAAVAAIVWSMSGPGPVSYHAGNIMIAASLHTLLFNANPLMKFDGYHMLADWLEVPNLANYGNNFIKGFMGWVFFGTPMATIEYAGYTSHLIKVYGVLALLWRILLCIVLSLAAANLFTGIGILMVFAASIFWLWMPAFKLCKYLVFGGEFYQPNRIQFALVTTVMLTAVFFSGRYLPAPAVITAPIVIDYESRSVIRAETAGFIEEIFCQPNQKVEQGDILLVATNPDLENEYRRSRLELKAAEVRATLFQSRGDIPSWQSEVEAIASLKKQIHQSKRQLDALTVRAPSEGFVVDRNIDDMIGQYVSPGTELVLIGDSVNKEVVGLVSQLDSVRLPEFVGNVVEVRVWGSAGLKKGVIHRIAPKSSVELEHFAFAGINGGPLEVAKRSELERAPGDEAYVLLKPRVELRIALDEETSRSLMAGQTGVVHIQGKSSCLGEFLIDRFHNWLRQSLTLNHGV